MRSSLRRTRERPARSIDFASTFSTCRVRAGSPTAGTSRSKTSSRSRVSPGACVKYHWSLPVSAFSARVELANSSIQGGHGSIEWVFSGTDAGMFKTGKQFSVRGVSIVTVKNGKISRNIDYYDVATLMKQVGLLPPEDSAPKN